jgi:hypothetical protein
MKPWDDPRTVAQFRRMSGVSKAQLAIEMAEAQWRILLAGLRDQHPRMSRRRLREEAFACLWRERSVRERTKPSSPR